MNRSENLTVSATWAVLCVLTCLLGMLTKEVMVSAPVIIFLYDRAFLSGTFCQAWRSHRRLYLGMACTWVALGWLVLHSGERGGSAGFGIGVSWWSYVLTQFPAILHYLRLTLWPHPLVFDYWVDWVNQPWRVAPAAVVVAGLAAASLWGTFRPRAPKIAFLGLCFFAILAPTSLVPGKSQTLAEHRMYLALAPVIVGGVGAVYAGLGRRVLIIGFPLAALAGGWVTIHRNRAYRDDLTLWSDTAAIRPQNARAHFYRGVALGDAGRTAEEVRELNRALELNSDYPEAYDSLGIALAKTGANREAIGYYRKALRLKPELADAHYNLGTALAQLGRTPEAIAELEVALSLKAEYPEAQNNLGSALVTAGRVPEAAGHFSEAVRLMPERAEYSYDWAMALANLGRTPEAISRYEDALRLRPDYAEAQGNLGVALAMSGRTPEAIRHFERAAQLRPASPKAHYNLAGALVSSGRTAEAIAEYRRALRLQPDYYEAHYQLGMALRAAGHLAEADLELEAAERLQAGQPAAVP